MKSLTKENAGTSSQGLFKIRTWYVITFPGNDRHYAYYASSIDKVGRANGIIVDLMNHSISSHIISIDSFSYREPSSFAFIRLAIQKRYKGKMVMLTEGFNYKEDEDTLYYGNQIYYQRGTFV